MKNLLQGLAQHLMTIKGIDKAAKRLNSTLPETQSE